VCVCLFGGLFAVSFSDAELFGRLSGGGKGAGQPPVPTGGGSFVWCVLLLSNHGCYRCYIVAIVVTLLLWWPHCCYGGHIVAMVATLCVGLLEYKNIFTTSFRSCVNFCCYHNLSCVLPSFPLSSSIYFTISPFSSIRLASQWTWCLDHMTQPTSSCHSNPCTNACSPRQGNTSNWRAWPILTRPGLAAGRKIATSWKRGRAWYLS